VEAISGVGTQHARRSVIVVMAQTRRRARAIVEAPACSARSVDVVDRTQPSLSPAHDPAKPLHFGARNVSPRAASLRQAERRISQQGMGEDDARRRSHAFQYRQAKRQADRSDGEPLHRDRWSFRIACTELIQQGIDGRYVDLFGDPDRSKKLASKTKYTCPECGLNAWGKPTINLVCGDCDKRM
jgi:hypothetical protein